MAKRIIYWFRNDLRLEENEAFNQAFQNSKEIVPVFVFDIRQFEETRLGFRRTGALRAQMIINAVGGLRESLRKKGGELVIRIGQPETIIPALAEEFQADYVYASKKIGPKETAIESTLSKNLKVSNIDFKLIWMDTLLNVAALPFPVSKLPANFRKYHEFVNAIHIPKNKPGTISKLAFNTDTEGGPLPGLAALGIDPAEVAESVYFAIPNFGEEAAQRDLDAFLNDLKNGVFDSSHDPLVDSSLSIWLALGCISPKKIYFQVKDIAGNIPAGKATLDSLHYRDYANFNLLRFGPRFFKPSGIQHHFHKRWKNDLQEFNHWKDGNTENEQINAILQKLKKTGQIKLEERYLAARFLAEQLNVNWVWGAMYFESLLLDYDVAVSWGRWNGVAQVGFD